MFCINFKFFQFQILRSVFFQVCKIMSAPVAPAESTKTAAGIIAKDAQEEDASELRFPPG